MSHQGAESSDAPSDDGNAIKGDWREFRASLINAEQNESAGTSGDLWSSRWTQENLRLLQEQDRKLAREGLWAHETELPEVGGLLLARAEAPDLNSDSRLCQLVIFLLEHGPNGSKGVIINRPARANVGDLLEWGYQPSQAYTEEDAKIMKESFADSVLYLGGFYPPNRITRQPLIMLHGHRHLEGCREVSPGIYTGGEVHAGREIASGALQASSFRFFAGMMEWESGRLLQDIQRGLWYTAACSRSLVIKQCLQLPVPLWKEVLILMGGSYAAIAHRRYM
ncbi:g1173 [Coccomyxa viridis]|uniref:G1173 protein n=1 Tax=Coccomyxa viridis TaxID=1274662 RepID=A0ABP1FJ21_9CHLO